MSQPPLTDTEKKTIIDRLRSRLEAYDLKLGTKRALDAECHFMCGAMTAINVLSPNTDDPEALSPSVPREWILDLMRGKSVLKE